MAGDNPNVGDRFTVFIDRRSNSGNLICRQSSRYHVVESIPDGHNPCPHERWRIKVVSVNHTVIELEPLKQLDTYPRDAPKPKKGDGTNPFKWTGTTDIKDL